MQKEVKVKTLLLENKEKYLAIVLFTKQFADKKEWFREYHIRYALEKNHDLSPPIQKTLANEFDNELKMEYANPYSPIKKCFDSRSNLVDHLKYLVDLELMERKTINGKNHYRFNNRNAHQLFYAYDYAWFRELPDKVSSELLGKMRNDLESKYREELKASGALFLRYRI